MEMSKEENNCLPNQLFKIQFLLETNLDKGKKRIILGQDENLQNMIIGGFYFRTFLANHDNITKLIWS